MRIFLQACAGVLLAVFLILAQGNQRKDMGALLSMAGCCLVALAALWYLEPVVDFLRRLETMGRFNSQMIQILMKIAGIGILTEIVTLVCNDAGNSSMGKSVQLLGSVVILWLSLPVFTMLLDLLQEILGDI